MVTLNAWSENKFLLYICHRYKCGHWKSIVSSYIIWYVLGPNADEIWNQMVRNVQNFDLFDEKPNFFKAILYKALMPFCKAFQKLKQLFNGKVLIFRLLSFSVPKILVVQSVKPGLRWHQTWQTRPVRNKFSRLNRKKKQH